MLLALRHLSSYYILFFPSAIVNVKATGARIHLGRQDWE